MSCNDAVVEHSSLGNPTVVFMTNYLAQQLSNNREYKAVADVFSTPDFKRAFEAEYRTCHDQQRIQRDPELSRAINEAKQEIKKLDSALPMDVLGAAFKRSLDCRDPLAALIVFLIVSGGSQLLLQFKQTSTQSETSNKIGTTTPWFSNTARAAKSPALHNAAPAG